MARSIAVYILLVLLPFGDDMEPDTPVLHVRSHPNAITPALEIPTAHAVRSKSSETVCAIPPRSGRPAAACPEWPPRCRILEKLELVSVSALIRYALEHKLID
ncbi:MAG: hypothetical protein HQM00_05800 [Magnetococcales bacterium]|nr:hypothetical protein [Magnetococcales bacterium]